ncbi:hypothetical protein KLP40_16185, partial [Hymenobacter sp. NST-14]|uniref:hypothetical protein n=1 Tax=Hymenobacter piscis TaxID=2839984 RepID=UPI001C02613D
VCAHTCASPKPVEMLMPASYPPATKKALTHWSALSEFWVRTSFFHWGRAFRFSEQPAVNHGLLLRKTCLRR